MKKTAAFLLSLVLLFAAASAAFAQEKASVTFPVYEDTEFGMAQIDASQEEFAELGAQFGDSLDVRFSNGYTVEDIPYYNGYYERVNHPAVVNYPGQGVAVAYCSGDSMWKLSGCVPGDSVTLTIREKGKYLERQNVMASVYTDDRDDYESDEAFANFRAMAGGKLRSDTFFRGASPLDNIHKRAAITDSLLKKAGVRFVLDLSDNEKKLIPHLEKEDFASHHAASLLEKGEVILLGLSASYRSDAYKASLAKGLLEMMRHEGPYYIHCTEGKDRTGFVCLLLEALADASYEEIEADYMKSYENYFGITKESAGTKYEALKEMRLLDMLWWLADLPDNTDLAGMHFKEAAEDYLRSAGLTDEKIEKLENFLTEKNGSPMVSGSNQTPKAPASPN